jgi:peptidoglycan/xylan/chitin deacetylase (PgdA/CDA1 family)
LATLRNPFTRCPRAGRIFLLTLFALALSGVSSARAQTVVSITFDDGIETQQSVAAPLLAAHGMHGTFYINSELVGSKPYFMNWAQVDSLAAQGNEIGGHTLTHVRLPDLTDTEQRRQICDDAANLRARGYNVSSFAYPYGAGTTSTAARSALMDCGYLSARKVGGLRSDVGCGAACPFAESLPPPDVYKVKASPYLDGAITLSDLEGWVMDAESNGGGWLPLMFHDICDNCLSSSVSPSDFSSFLTWLDARSANGTVVKTMRDALAGAPKPPPTTAIACNGNACSSNWQKGPVQVTLSATDGGGGLGATRYTLDGSDPTPSSPQYSGPFTLTGSATVKFRTWDLQGNPEAVKTQQLKIDPTGPAGQITSPADGASTTGAVTVKVDATDAGSGVRDVQLFADGNYLAFTKTSPYQFSLAAGSLSLGTHKLKALVTDAVGNQTWTALVTLTVVSALPTTSIVCGGAACPTGFVKGPVSVSLIATDGGGGISATRYTLDGSDPSTSSTQYTGAFMLTGTTTVKFRSYDAGGNPEAVRTQQLKIDAVPPTGAISSPADGTTVFPGDLTVKVDATDAGSGMSGVELFVDGDYRDYSRSSASPYLLTLAKGTLSLGTHKLKALVRDALGNQAWTPVITITLKDGLPTTAIACGGAACPTAYVKGPVSVSLTATDGGGGLSATRYTLDGSDPSPSSPQYTSPFTLTTTTTVKFRSYDAGGNAEAVRSQQFKIDAVPPTAAISSPADGTTVIAGDLTVKVNATDAGSGISGVELFVDGDYRDYSRSSSSPYQFTLAKGTLSLGTHKLKALVSDLLGNSTWTAPTTLTIKDGLPTTSIACDGGACPTAFVKGPVQVTLAAVDGGNGVSSTRYTTDGSNPDTSSPVYSAPFTLTDTTTVKFRSYDSNGNAEPIKTQTIKIDAIAPTAQITSPLAGQTVSGDVTVKIDATDTGSGVWSVEVYVDGDYVDYSRSTSSPYTITWHAGAFAPGTHKLKARVTDALGNTASTAWMTVTVSS